MTVVAGIDPGMTGAVAVFVHGKPTVVADMPTYDGRVDGLELCGVLDLARPDVVYLENTHPMPRNGSIASYKLGLNTGIVIGVVQSLSIPLTRIAASTWKNWNGLRGKPKEASLHLARELWPHLAGEFRRRKDEGRAEAALIGRYGVYRQVHDVTGGDDDEDRGVARHPAGGAGRADGTRRGDAGAAQGVERGDQGRRRRVVPLEPPAQSGRGEEEA